MAKNTILIVDDEQANLEMLRQTIHDLQKKLAAQDLLIEQEIANRKEVEKALEQSEKSLKKSQEIAKTGSWHLDIERNELHWSDEVYRIAFSQANPGKSREMINGLIRALSTMK